MAHPAHFSCRWVARFRIKSPYAGSLRTVRLSPFGQLQSMPRYRSTRRFAIRMPVAERMTRLSPARTATECRITDLCPDTPPGTLVDSDGCPSSSGACCYFYRIRAASTAPTRLRAEVSAESLSETTRVAVAVGPSGASRTLSEELQNSCFGIARMSHGSHTHCDLSVITQSRPRNRPSWRSFLAQDRLRLGVRGPLAREKRCGHRVIRSFGESAAGFEFIGVRKERTVSTTAAFFVDPARRNS